MKPRTAARAFAALLVVSAVACGPFDEEPDVGPLGFDARVEPAPPFDPPGDCSAVIGVPIDALFEPDVVRLVTLLPESGPAGEIGRGMRQAVALALEEVAAVGGLPGAVRVGALACDSRTDPARAVELVRWMLADFETPAIIGPGLSAATLRLHAERLIARGPLFVSPSATHPLLAELADDGLFWRTAPDDGRPAWALGRWLAERGERVAVVARADGFGESLAEAALAGVCGGPCAEQRARRWLVEPGGDVAPVVEAIIASGFDAVALLGGAGETDRILRLLVEGEAAIRAIGLGELSSDPGFVASLPAALRPRLAGARHGAAEGIVADGFADRYRARWGGDPGPFAAHAYDAAWLVLHAMAALPPGTPLDGDALGQRLGRMSEGRAVPSGPAGWLDGQAAFRDPRAGTFDFDGASGPLDFDATGQAPAPVQGWTVSADGAIVGDGLWLRADEGP